MTAAQFIAARTRLHWTQPDAAAALGLTVKAITDLEKGRKPVSKTVARLLAFHRHGDDPRAEPQAIRDRSEANAAAAAVTAERWQARLEAGRSA